MEDFSEKVTTVEPREEELEQSGACAEQMIEPMDVVGGETPPADLRGPAQIGTNCDCQESVRQ